MQGYALENSTKDEMVQRYLPLVNRMANRLAMGLPDHVDKDDLVSSGVMGLLDAMEKYNPAKGPFNKYVPLRIKGAMLDELRKMSWLPRSLLSKARLVDKAYAALRGELGRTPNEEELAVYLNVSTKEVSLLLAQVNTRSLVYLEDYLFDTDDGARKVEDYVQETGEWASPEDSLLQKESTEMLSRAIDGLPEREQLVLHLYYQDELTLKEIGEVLNITESRVSQIHGKVMLKLRHHLKEG